MQRLALAVLAVAIALLAWFAFTRDRTGAIRTSPNLDHATPSVSEPVALADPDPAPAAASTSVRATSSIPEAPASVDIAPEVEARQASLGGRIVLPDGSPARGVPLTVRGWAGMQERRLKYGIPDVWEDPQAESDADGLFLVHFDPPRAFMFQLEAQVAGFAPIRVQWQEIESGARIDVGDLTLVVAGSIRARVVDSTGRALTNEWRVEANCGSGARGRADVDASTGFALIENLPPGPAILTAFAPIANWIEGPTVEVRAGDVVDANVRYTGADLSRRITATVFTKPFHAFGSRFEGLALHGVGSAPRRAVRIENASQSFAFDDLVPGRYRLESDDPRFLPWSLADLEPGTAIDVKLKGSAAVRLSVVHPDGTAVDCYDLDVRFESVEFMPNVFRIHENRAEVPAGGVFDGLIPAEQTLVVRADGFAPLEIPMPALLPNEMRVVNARLTRGGSMSGFVRTRGSNAPHANVPVELRAEEKSEKLIRMRSTDDHAVRTARTDSAGHFEFEMVGDGDWTVEATVSPALRPRRSVAVVAGSAADASIEVAPTGVVVGRLIGPARADWTGMTVLAMPRKAADVSTRDGSGSVDWSRLPAQIEVDGTFQTPLLPVGIVELFLRMPDARIQRGFSSWSTSEGGRIELEVLALAEGENVREYDVRDRFPGELAVVARVNGEPAKDFFVQVDSIPPVGSAARIGACGVVALDAQGRGTLRPLVPGEYRVALYPIDGTWRFRDERSWHVTVDGSTTIVLDVELIEGTLRVVDEATEMPIASATLGLSARGAQSSEFDVRTDPEGRIVTHLPVGNYELWFGSDPFRFECGPAFEWTRNGPEPKSVPITLRK